MTMTEQIIEEKTSHIKFLQKSANIQSEVIEMQNARIVELEAACLEVKRLLRQDPLPILEIVDTLDEALRKRRVSDGHGSRSDLQYGQ